MGIDLKKEFIRAQALLPSRISGDSHFPSKSIGGIIFPPKEGKLVSMADVCDLKEVIQYIPLAAVGESLEKPNGMLGHIASFTVSASSEDEMIETIQLVQKWFHDHVKINDTA